MFVLDPHYKLLQFSTFLRVHLPVRVHSGHARRHGQRSLEMWTVERVDFTQERDCHYLNSWSVDRWTVCRSWLVLMSQLNIVVFGIFATFSVARAVGRTNSCTDSPSNRVYASLATRMFPLPWTKTVFFFCFLTIAPLLIVQNVAPRFLLLV